MTPRPHLTRPIARTFILATAVALGACGKGEGRTAEGATAGASAAADSARPTKVTFTRVGEVAATEIDESSGLAASRSAPGVFWTMNDDTDPVVFAIDSAGADLGRVRLQSAKNVDWESIAVGPCGAANCLYAGDTGDNEGVRASRAIYRIPEPTRTNDRFPTSASAERLTYRYSDGPKDVEAMYVSPDESVWLVSKRPLRDSTGRHRPALVYRIPKEAWASKDTAVAALVDSLPVVPGSAPGRLVTDASLSPDGKLLALRTYTELYLFAVDATGRPRGAPRRTCDLTPVEERQGEGVAWRDGAGHFLLSSEGSEVPKSRSTLALVKCGP